jgi:exopolyphosphatase/guanosine-5'-triphosphate,3'-diphosphate pyrophosphatase
MSDQPLAVIDIGSNSGRMIVVRSPTGRHVETLSEAKAPLRLASDVAATGNISPAGIDRTIGCLEDFLAQARASGASRTIAVATAAVRDASNGDALVERVRAVTGLEVEIIDGEREAEFGFLGAVHSVPVESGMLLDVGGGSIEISRFRDRTMGKSWTLPLGALLLADRFFTEDPPGRGERKRLLEHITASLEEAKLPTLTKTERLVGTGGTIRNLAKMDRRERSYPIPRLHGYVLSLARVEEIVNLLSSRSLAKRATLSGLNPDRADSIVAGAIVVRTIVEALGAEEMTVSGKGLREGIAMEALTDTMHAPFEVRAASMAALGARFATWDAARAERRVALVSQLFDATDAGGGIDGREMLNHAATILDTGAALDAYNRHEHAAAAVLSGDLSGFSHPQLALIAAILRRADKESAGLKPYSSLLRAYDPSALTRAAVALAVADGVSLRLPQSASAEIRTGKSSIAAVGPLRGGRWAEKLSARTKTAFGRSFAVKTREDEP